MGNNYFKGAFIREDIVKKGLRFDAVFLLEVIEHLNDEYLNEIFEDLKRLLKKDGVAIITTPNDEKLEDNHIFCPQCEHVFHRWQHVRNWNEERLRAYVEQKGFKILELYATDFAASLKNKMAFGKHLIKKLLGHKSPKLVCVCKI